MPDVLTGQDTVLPLAGPANRQSRVAAESIAGRATNFCRIQATAVVCVLGLIVASTGASEKGLRRAGVTSFEKVYPHPSHHASYTRTPTQFISSCCFRFLTVVSFVPKRLD